jgi:hypothetical protein
MDEKDLRNGKVPEVVILERRSKNRDELSSADVMKILRKRAALAGKKSRFEVQWSDDAGGSGKATNSSG